MPHLDHAQQRRPAYLECDSVDEFFNKRRRQLLRRLDREHSLRTHIDSKTGQLLAGVPHIPTDRKILTDDAIRNYRQRKRGIDPDNAKRRLQGSQLIQMWNADHESEDHWHDFDRVRHKMEWMQRQFGSRRQALFLDGWTVDERRRYSRTLYLIRTGDLVLSQNDVALHEDPDRSWDMDRCPEFNELSKQPSEEKRVYDESDLNFDDENLQHWAPRSASLAMLAGVRVVENKSNAPENEPASVHSHDSCIGYAKNES